jgi:putative acetyltransferase
MATSADADEMACLYYNTIRAVNSRDYDAERINAWSGPAPDPGMWRNRIEGKITFVACIGDMIAGFAEFEPDGHIDAFYVHHQFQGKGVGTKLLERIYEEGLKLGVSRYYLEASITAKPFFRKKGFTVTSPQDVSYRGHIFRNYNMETKAELSRASSAITIER